jgi:hypothetical protein
MRGCAAKGLEPDKTLAWELVGFEVGFGTEARSADKIIARLRTRLRRDRTSVISRSSRLGRAVAGERRPGLLGPGNIPITIQR